MRRCARVSLGTALVALVACGASGGRADHARPESAQLVAAAGRHDDRENVFAVPKGPCPGPGTRADIDDLTALPYQALMPDAPEANRGTVVRIALCPGSTAVIRFRSGLVLRSQAGTSRDPDVDIRRFVASDREEASLATVLGHTAGAIKPDAAGTAVGSVYFADCGATFWLSGNGRLSADDLVRVANTLEPLS